MLTVDETKEVRLILNKIDNMIFDIEFGFVDEDIKYYIDTLKMVKTSYMHFLSELGMIDRKQ